MKQFLAFTLLLTLLACKKENMDDCFTSTGKISSENRPIENFKKLEIYDHFEVVYSQAAEHSIKITAGKNLLESIKTTVVNGTLILENKNKCNWVRNLKKEISIEITSPTLNEISYYGSNTLIFPTVLKTDTFLLNMLEASGDLTLKVEANYMELKSHTGTGTVSCSGTANELVTYIAGNGFVNAKEILGTTQVLAVNENTGKLIVNTNGVLDAAIRNSGNIEYLGTPSHIHLEKTGKGKLVKLEN